MILSASFGWFGASPFTPKSLVKSGMKISVTFVPFSITLLTASSLFSVEFSVIAPVVGFTV